jgi:exopolysaccharide production protein ExoZ
MVFFGHSIYYSSIAPNVVSAAPWWLTGFLSGSGVAIFFTLSGYLIVNIAKISTPKDFIRHRLIRIFPGYWLAIFIYFCIQKFNFSLFSWESFLLIPFFNNYNTYNIPAWSLFYEIQFYLYVFILLMIAKFIKKDLRFLIYLTSFVWFILIIYFCLVVVPNLNSQIPGIYIIFSSINLIFIGGIFSDKLNVKFLINRNYINLIIGSLLYFLSLYIEPISNRLLPNVILSFGGIFLLNFFYNFKTSSNSLLENFSDKSYGVYLIHLIILDEFFLILQKYGFNTTYQFVWFIILALLAFIPSFYFGVIENKFHKNLKSFMR